MALGARALFGSALFLAWACAHQTGSDLGGSSTDNPAAGKGGSAAKGGTGGTGAKGGSGGSTGGTSASAGKGGTGTGGASTGGSATGGSATGGTATGGSGNATAKGGGGGTAGDTANGGQAGDDTIPPDVLANASVVLHYYTRGEGGKDTSKAVDTRMFLENKSDDPLPMSQVKVRYWTTFEVEGTNLKCYHAGPNIGSDANVTLEVVHDGDDTHILIGFTSGMIPAHNSSPFSESEFQMKVDAPGDGTFVQSNDWSFEGAHDESIPPPVPNGKITVYLADKLIWGCEPSNRKCAGDDGAAGQGGQGGQAGETGTGGSVSAGQGGEPNAGQGGA